MRELGTRARDEPGERVLGVKRTSKARAACRHHMCNSHLLYKKDMAGSSRMRRNKIRGVEHFNTGGTGHGQKDKTLVMRQRGGSGEIL